MGFRAAALTALIGFSLVACAPVSKIAASPKPVNARHCADIVARAFSSPDQPVNGVMQCLDSSIVDQANQSGVFDDHDFMSIIATQPPVFNSDTYCGVAHNGDLVYALASTDGSVTGRLALHINNTNGLVEGINTTDGSGCPQGLR